MHMMILYLTCANGDEAINIASALLEARLVACVRRSQVSSSYWWKDKINNDDEILLMMESLEEKFGAIEAVVKKLHSYDEPVLTAMTVSRTTAGTLAWLDQVLRHAS